MAEFAWKLLVNTDDAFLEFGSYVSKTPINNDDISDLLELAMKVKNWDYTLDRVHDVVLTCVDLDTFNAVIFDIEPADVWPTDFDNKKSNYYAHKGGEKKEAWLERHFRAQS